MNLRKTVKSLHNHILYSLVVYCILFIFNALGNLLIWKSNILGQQRQKGVGRNLAARRSKKWGGEQEKWLREHFLPLLRAKMRGGKKRRLWGKCAFSTLISAGKVKRIYRKRMIKRWNSEYSERRIQDKQEGKAPIKMIAKKLIINNLTRNLSIKIRQSQ